MMRRNYLVKQYYSQRLALPIDNFHNKCYVVSNILARPLPQGTLNYGEFFYGAE